LQFFGSLKKAGAEFGYRTASEIHRFTTIAPKIKDWDCEAIFDFVIIQKLLPKVHGSRRKLEPILKTLAGLCLYQPERTVDLLKPEIDETKIEYASVIKYPLSFDKIKRMYQNLIDNSFTSYAEA
jgi:5-methylcytosine-specific restriction protein B